MGQQLREFIYFLRYVVEVATARDRQKAIEADTESVELIVNLRENVFGCENVWCLGENVWILCEVFWCKNVFGCGDVWSLCGEVWRLCEVFFLV